MLDSAHVRQVALPEGLVPSDQLGRLVVEVPLERREAFRTAALRTGHTMTWIVNSLITEIGRAHV